MTPYFIPFVKYYELISADNGQDSVQISYPANETRLRGHSNPRFVA